jgi:hypothetical protein
MYFTQHCFICRPSDSNVSEDARTVGTLELAVKRRSKLLTIRLDLIHKRLDPIVEILSILNVCFL